MREEISLNKDAHLHALQENYDAMAAAARQGLEPQVPGCPAWSVGGLMGHMVLVYANWNAKVRGWRGGKGLEREDLDVYPGYAEWAEADFPGESTPAQILDWLDEVYGQLYQALAAADPGDTVQTWFPPNQTAGFVQRRMAQETAVHRWDAQSAHGKQEPIEAELARDGIDEMVDIHLPMHREWIEPRPGAGERYHFHRTDGDGEWLVVFAPEKVEITREHAKGDVAIRGSASDLLLWFWGRVPADRLEVLGEAALAERWFELVPAD
jgi:uncharacterized protein (TIGR03083 family)